MKGKPMSASARRVARLYLQGTRPVHFYPTLARLPDGAESIENMAEELVRRCKDYRKATEELLSSVRSAKRKPTQDEMQALLRAMLRLESQAARIHQTVQQEQELLVQMNTLWPTTPDPTG